MRYAAIGIVEIQSYANAIYAMDLILKRADVTLIGWEKKLGGRLVTMIFTGTVSSAKAATDYIKEVFDGDKSLKISEVIANPSAEIMQFIIKKHNVEIENVTVKSDQEDSNKQEKIPKKRKKDKQQTQKAVEAPMAKKKQNKVEDIEK